MQNVSTYLPVRLVEQIENNKGDVSRNLFIRRAILQAIEKGNGKVENNSAELLGVKGPTMPQSATKNKPTIRETIEGNLGGGLNSD
jgi:hypothetical protein